MPVCKGWGPSSGIDDISIWGVVGIVGVERGYVGCEDGGPFLKGGKAIDPQLGDGEELAVDMKRCEGVNEGDRYLHIGVVGLGVGALVISRTGAS